MKRVILAAAVAMCFAPAYAANQTYTVDLVVVGAGAGGSVAALSAVEGGLKTLLLEKNAFAGGAGNFMEGSFAAESFMQKEAGVKLTKIQAFNEMAAYHHWTINAPLVKAFVDESAETIQWVWDHGVHWKEVKTAWREKADKTWHIYPSAGSLPKAMIEQFKAKGGQLLLQTPAEKLIFKDGKVTGIQVTNKKDGTYTIHAKAVVDAAGGFGANNDLVSKYVPRLKGFATTNHPGATGDGLLLAEKAGAQLIDMTEIQTHPTVVPKVGEMITEAVRGNGAILINKDGKRFFNELNTRDAVSAAILKQKDGVAFLFFDSDMQKSLKATNKYIKQSYCVSGATIEEVAGKMGVPAAELQASIDAWKKGKAAGKDAFGRADMPRNLDQAPFYAIMVTPAVHHTMGGIKIDSKTQVYNAKGQVVPGLFAAGEITGGVHGGNRLGGNAQADIVTFGRIAGQQSYIYAMQAAAADKAKK